MATSLDASPADTLPERLIMIYSSIWDGLLKLALLIGLIGGSVAVTKTLGCYEYLREHNLVIYLVLVLLAIHFALYRSTILVFVLWLHGWVTLQSPITFADARALRRLFQLDLSFTWICMDAVRHLPVEERREALMAALETVGPERKVMLF